MSLEIRQIQSIDNSVSDQRSNERSGQREHGSERETNQRGPAHPDPPALPGRLVQQAEQDGLRDQPDPGLEQSPEEQLLTHGAEDGQHSDARVADARGNGPQLSVQCPGPRDPGNQCSGRHHDYGAERQADRQAVAVPVHGGQAQPRVRMRQWRALSPDERDAAGGDSQQAVRGGEAAPADHGQRHYGTAGTLTHLQRAQAAWDAAER